MSGKKRKSGKQNTTSTEKLVLLTAILELVNAIVDLVDRMTN